MSDLELTDKERKAIDALQKLMKRWPKSLWLFSNGTMHIMKYKDDGKRAMNGGSVDAKFCVSSISGVLSEGGDW